MLPAIGQVKSEASKFSGIDTDPELHSRLVIGFQNVLFNYSGGTPSPNSGSDFLAYTAGLNGFYKLNKKIEFQAEINYITNEMTWIELGGTYYFIQKNQKIKRLISVGYSGTTSYYTKIRVPILRRIGVRANVLHQGLSDQHLQNFARGLFDKFNTTYFTIGLAYNARSNGYVYFEDYLKTPIFRNTNIYMDAILPIASSTSERGVDPINMEGFTYFGYRLGANWTTPLWKKLKGSFGFEYLSLRGVNYEYTLFENTQNEETRQDSSENGGWRLTFGLKYAF
jgi:hypothetical protein